MKNNAADNTSRQKKFQIKIGEEIACVEVVSLKDKIYSVELPGKEPLFITEITDINNKKCWVSIPHGNNVVAEIIGACIEKEIDPTLKEGGDSTE